MPGTEYFTNLAFTPSGRSFVTTGALNELVEWDVETGKEVGRLGRGVMFANHVAFSPDGKTLALAGPGGSVRLIDPVSGQDRSTGDGHPMTINDVAVTPDGKTVVTSGLGPNVLFWDPATGRVKHRRPPAENDAWYYRLSRDCRTGLAGEPRGRVLWVSDLRSGVVRSRIPLDFLPDMVQTAAISRGGELVALRGIAGEALTLVDSASGAVAGTFEGRQFQGCKARFTDDGKTLFIFRTDFTAEVWDLTRREKLRQFGLPSGADAPAAPAGKPVLPVPLGTVTTAPFNVTVSPDGRRIALTGQNGQIFFLDGQTGEEVSRLEHTSGSPSILTFSADGRMLAWVGGNDLAVHLVEVETGKERRAFTGHRGEVFALAFAPDDSFLVSGGLDTTALVWDLTGRVAADSPRGEPLADRELDARWAALAGADADAAFRAVQDLAASPAGSVAYLGNRLKPVVPAEGKLVAGLISDLDSDQFETRSRAARRLEELGARALGACHEALAGKLSVEVRTRLEEIVQKQLRKWRKSSGEEVRTLRALEALERAGTPEARRLLQALADGVPEARMTVEAKASLERLAGRQSAGRTEPVTSPNPTR